MAIIREREADEPKPLMLAESRWRARWKAIAKFYRAQLKRPATNFCPNCETTERRNAELEAATAAFAAQRVGEIEQRREMRKQIAELKAEVDARVDDGIDLNAETERAEAWRKYAEKVEKELRAELQTAQADSAALRQLLLSLEWNAPMGNCPDCGGRGPDSGHFTWCRLAPVLATPNPGAELLAEITSLNKSHEVAQDTIRRQWEVIRELRAGQVRHDEPEPPEYQRTADPDC